MVAPKKQASSAGGNVRVVVRIRPLSAAELERGCKESITEMESEFAGLGDSSYTEVLQVKGASKNWFEFDAVIGSQCSQSDVYQRSGAFQSITEDIFRGYNATLLAYGQTGAGKTYTMGTFGDTNDEAAGILPRAVDDMFANILSKCDGNGKVELSYLEIYNEEIRDLLSNQTPKNPEKKSHVQLKIRETLNGEVYVSGLTAKEVNTPKEIGDLLEEASSRRVVGSTAMNAVSSRSHAICTFKISGVLEGSEKFTSKLTLVDLAGSERIKKTGAEGSRQLEGIHINKSLMVLGQVVSALADGRNKKPPYRDSKLTRLLQDSLGGNSRTISKSIDQHGLKCLSFFFSHRSLCL
jgi:kinesin family protein 4/21/27